ncbi:hypothetical protein HBH98_242490 [Parastagonospora nodorum]|nr:hypothetical protein HBI13_209390 [Parastagonospora nodorum]KAH4043894.1 hypothetical protein HBH49_227590 [Parastagonospora nodorum]KAH4095280.1 hypothetical protein HBH46_171890 [Parastagonospora nodorum]KAH4288572.1 hypothetical protein HBI01_220590 [Parastagonospora nodorum]KAH4334373.1 hypothetical protein HBH98_242490 [Parastagonospora nodorum]
MTTWDRRPRGGPVKCFFEATYALLTADDQLGVSKKHFLLRLVFVCDGRRSRGDGNVLYIAPGTLIRELDYGTQLCFLY